MPGGKKVKEEPEALAPMWVVTYGDLVSLLVTFFVLIFTFSSMDPDRTRRVRGALTGGEGIMTDEEEKSRTADVNTRPKIHSPTDYVSGQDRPPERSNFEDLQDNLNSRVQDPTVFNQVVRLAEYDDGVRISIQADRLFRLGSWRVTGTAEEILREVGRFFKAENVDLIVEAHTDNATHKWVEGLDAETLTERMAFEAAQVLIQETGWQPARLGVSPRGDSKPVASNETPVGREQNRRIDILVKKHGVGR